MIQAFVTGNIGKPAETRQAGKDTVTSFSVASNRKVKGEEAVTWVRCSIWGKRGESLCQYLDKGTRVAVSGELSTRDHDGKTYVELRVAEIDFMGGKRDGSSSSRGRDDSPPDDDRDEAPGQRRFPVDSDGNVGGSGSADDDDIPF